MKKFMYERYCLDSFLKKIGKSQGDVYSKRKIAENYFASAINKKIYVDCPGIERVNRIQVFAYDVIGLGEKILYSASLQGKVGKEVESIASIISRVSRFFPADVDLGSREAQEILATFKIDDCRVSGDVLSLLGYKEIVLLSDFFLVGLRIKLSKRFRDAAIELLRKKMSGLSKDEAYKLVLSEIENSSLTHPEISQVAAERKEFLGGPSYDKLISYSKFLKCSELCQVIDSTYSEFLKGKTVAIVGPAGEGGESGKEIDEYDVVIKTNFKASSTKMPKEIYGERCDVSYYNSGDPVSKFDEVFSVISDLKFACFKSGKAMELYKDHENIATLRPVVHNWMYFKGAANMLQIILYEVLNSSPSKVKVFCVNFFAGKNLYSKHYRSIGVSGKNLVCHDPWANFSFVKNLWINGRIEVDKITGEVLGLSQEKFTDRLEDLHGRE